VFKIIIGIIIGALITLLIVSIQYYLKTNHLKLKWKNLFIALGCLIIIAYLIYSFIGMVIAPKYTKSNGNVCKGFKYGIQVCSGDINAE
jgi:uncharacterized protein YneF (UPF0154 family)